MRQGNLKNTEQITEGRKTQRQWNNTLHPVYIRTDAIIRKAGVEWQCPRCRATVFSMTIKKMAGHAEYTTCPACHGFVQVNFTGYESLNQTAEALRSKPPHSVIDSTGIKTYRGER